MARIPNTPSPKTFAETWSADFKTAVEKAAGKDGRLSVNEAKKIAASTGTDAMFADNVSAYFAKTGKQTVSVEVLVRDAKAYALRAAETAAGPDHKLSLEDGKTLPKDLVEDFFLLRGKTVPGTTPVTGASTLPAVKAALEAATVDLWMPSETDARFAFLAGTQLNGAAITPAVIRAQLTTQHDASIGSLMWVDPSEVSLANKSHVDVRPGTTYLQHIVDAADPNDPDSLARADRFRALINTVNANLTDVSVVRFGDVSISTFIVGRTRSGELAALLTGQVET